MMPVQLNSDLVGPENDEFDRIEEAASRVNELLEGTFESPHRRVHWSWGDSTSWLIILGVPSEADVAGLISSEAVAALASQLVQIIGSVVALNDGFKLVLEIDSDERVKAKEGWFLRIKGDAPRGRELVFVWSGERLSRA